MLLYRGVGRVTLVPTSRAQADAGAVVAKGDDAWLARWCQGAPGGGPRWSTHFGGGENGLVNIERPPAVRQDKFHKADAFRVRQNEKCCPKAMRLRWLAPSGDPT